MTQGVQRDVLVFLRRDGVTAQAVGFIAGGVVLLGMLALVFVSSLSRPAKPGDDMMPGMLGGVSVIGIGMLARGLMLLRTTNEVILDVAGVAVRSLVGQRFFAWYDVGRVERDKRSSLMGLGTHQVVRLFDRQGKRLTEIADTIDDFEILAEEVTRRSSEVAGRATHDAAADEREHTAKEVRRIKWVSVGFAFFTVCMIAAFIVGLYEEGHNRRYATEGVHVEAKIVRRWVVNVTPHLEFTFSDAQGRGHTREAMIYQRPFDDLATRDAVPVEYLRSQPEWNRAAGEDPGATFGGKFLLLTGGGIIMFGLLFLVTLFGYDLKSENGVTRLTRHGVTIKRWGGPPQPRAPAPPHGTQW